MLTLPSTGCVSCKSVGTFYSETVLPKELAWLKGTNRQPNLAATSSILQSTQRKYNSALLQKCNASILLKLSGNLGAGYKLTGPLLVVAKQSLRRNKEDSNIDGSAGTQTHLSSTEVLKLAFPTFPEWQCREIVHMNPKLEKVPPKRLAQRCARLLAELQGLGISHRMVQDRFALGILRRYPTLLTMDDSKLNAKFHIIKHNTTLQERNSWYERVHWAAVLKAGDKLSRLVFIDEMNITTNDEVPRLLSITCDAWNRMHPDYPQWLRSGNDAGTTYKALCKDAVQKVPSGGTAGPQQQ
eukprot:jgi/Chlat1/3758/Chrsp259S03903